MNKIYISFNDNDNNLVLPYIDKLKQDKFSITYNSNNTSNIKDCDYFVIFVNGNISTRIKGEIIFAQNSAKEIVWIDINSDGLDKGDLMQLQLATRITYDDECYDKLKSIISKKKHNIKVLIILLIVLLLGGCGFIAKTIITNKKAIKPIEEVKIRTHLSTTLEKALIQKGFDIDANGYISDDEIIDIKELDLSNLQIDDLLGIGNIVNLEKLNISNNKLTKLDDIIPLSKLIEVDISGNGIKDTSVLKLACPNLKVIND